MVINNPRGSRTAEVKRKGAARGKLTQIPAVSNKEKKVGEEQNMKSYLSESD